MTQPTQLNPAAAGFRRDDPEAQREAMLDQPLPAVRADLRVSPQLYLGRTVYMVKDPVALTYFRLNPAENYVLKQLDGRSNARQVADRVRRRFPDHRTSAEDVADFVKMLHVSGLLLGRSEGHGQWLRQVHDTRKRKKRIAQWTNFLFIKIPVIDPDRPLNLLYSFARLVMNRWTMALALGLMLVSGIAALAQIHRIGDLAFPILSWQNLMLLSATFLVVKVIHEFGHGLAAKHHGLEVHEMGIMLMVFFPIFYVDVSDAWMVPRRRDRLWITAGGVFIEFIFASIAVWVWLWTSPGVVNQVAFNIMLAASVTTVLFNANPLLRYDGYYFLMDWLQVPNLRAKAQRFLAYLAKRYLLLMPEQAPPDEASSRPIFMPLYAVAAGVYRWVIVFGIIILVWHILDPYGLEALGALMGMVAICTMVLLPLVKTLRFVWSQQAKTWTRLAASVGAMAGLGLVGWGAASIPWEQRVKQPLVVLAEQRQPLYTPVGGRVAEVLVRPGELLSAGQAILRLDDERLRDELADLEIERKIAGVDVERGRQSGRPDAVAAAAGLIDRLDQRIGHLRTKIEQLTIRAPFDGRLEERFRLRALIGTRLDGGDELGVMVGAGHRTMLLILPQAEASVVRRDMEAQMRLWADPSRTYTGRVARIGSVFLNELPHGALSSQYKGEVDTAPTNKHNARPAARSVVAEIVLDAEEEFPHTDGMTGRGKVIIGRTTLGQRQWRAFRQALSLDWWL